ncbi:MAG: alpha/beta fold hydrolase [Povalibacter sp.]
MFSKPAKIPFWTLFGLILFSLFLLHEARADNRVEVAGQGSDVILIPGLGSDGAAMHPVAEHLAQCHRTHTFTLAGFAGQSPDATPGLDAWTDSIRRYIDGLPSHRAVLIGHSLGGVLALKLAIDDPDQVDRVVILDSLPYLPAAMFPGATVDNVKPQAQQTRQMIANQSVEDFRASQQQALGTMTNQSQRVPDLLAWSMASDRQTLAAAYYDMFTTDLRSDIAKIHVPTLVLVPWDTGQPQDTATTLDLYRKQYAKLEGAQVKVVKGSRHFLTFDQPIATNWAIDEFLGKCPTPSAE